ncbi:MAG: M23 family metallopeptidase [Mizugakiibacter sp.]|uniref:M23 family metallopeptidase n=1 Tax=Mizugakiibacter sp. TaxID=1972610 RepID=UPI0031CA546C|nr:M23 family metallopeptidase [Xanthomonadaceae bacterium]
MNILLVSRSTKAPKTVDLTCTRVRRRIAVGLASAVLACAGLGAGLALWLANPRDRALAEIATLKAQVAQQRVQLGEVRRGAERDMNAMAVQLGRLEAQAMRLDALGERLTQAGKLGDGEFDFDQPPAVGGPELAGGDSYALPQGLGRSIDDLRAQFDRQQAQLDVLENLLLDRKVDSALRPTGMPVPGYIASYFGSRADPFSGEKGFHAGLDIDAAWGTGIHAVAEGVVTYASTRSGYGNVVEVDHGNGYMTRYAHASRLLVHPGQRVHAGQVIADVGSTGRSTGPHVHFEVWYQGRPVNPLAYVRGHR